MRTIRPISRTIAARLSVVALCSSTVLFAACSEATVASLSSHAELTGDSVAFRTDAQAYTVTPGEHGFNGRIAAIYTNRTTKPVYIANCNGSTMVALERLENGNWQQVYSPPVSLCLSVPMIVQPGGTHRFEFALLDAFPGAPVSGTYRAVWHSLVWDYEPDPQKLQQLPLELRVSNTFTIAPSN
ncbi:MAG: hypothetical protein IBJ03_10605 [Gemmatimonadaceae bacterium]|nr:hypothetical protein [Gemmatimonadaceae bacterium]